MIFRNAESNADNKHGYLFLDDIKVPICEIALKELIDNISARKGRVISGTFGTFNIKDFEKISGKLKDV